jgi:hypothetical protein
MLVLARVLPAIALIGALVAPAVCRAQQTTAQQPKEPVKTMGVGISGGIIAGAELSLIVESIADVEPVWPWIVAPIVTAAGGGVGGYYLDKNSSGGAIALLVVAMAALIPTTIGVSVAHEYEPEKGMKMIDESNEQKFDFEKDPTLDAASPNAEPATTTEVESRPDEAPPAAGEGVEGPSAPSPEPTPTPAPTPSGGSSARVDRAERPAWARHLASGSLLHLDADRDAGFGVPAIDVRPVAIADDAGLAAPRTGVELRLSLLRVDLP